MNIYLDLWQFFPPNINVLLYIIIIRIDIHKKREYTKQIEQTWNNNELCDGFVGSGHVICFDCHFEEAHDLIRLLSFTFTQLPLVEVIVKSFEEQSQLSKCSTFVNFIYFPQ